MASAQIAYGGTVSVTSLAEAGPGTLADAISQANSGGCSDACIITFATAGTITITTTFLPAITAANVTIDGYTAPSASVNTNAFGLADNAVIRIQLSGPGTGTGIDVGATATGATIRGLAIGGFGTGISIAAANGAVKGNFIGTDTLGTAQNANVTGVLITATGAVVGGADADRNVISSNSDGVVFDTGAANGIVEGNYIGMRADVITTFINGNIGVNVRTTGGSGHQIGNDTRPNLVNSFLAGIEVDSNGNSVKANRIGTNGAGTLGTGGNTIGVLVGGNGNTVEGNQISGNVGGVLISGNGNSFTGNLVGTDPTGMLSVANDNGVQVTGSNNSLTNNTIKFSLIGVIVDTNAGNAILDNVIALNSNIGIDLSAGFGSDGATPNDAQDLDPDFFAAGNNLQNFPDVHSATLSGGTLNLDIAVDSSGVPATAAFRLQTFKADSSGLRPQGAVLLDSRCVAGNKLGPYAISIPSAPVALGDEIVMTATSYTDAGCTTVGDGTSEFSFPVATVAAPLVVTNTNDSGAGSLRQAITDANACATPCTIIFNIPAPWPPVIQPATQLPTLTMAGTVIDGGTQTIFSSDANPNGPDLILDGTLAGVASNGLTIDASNVAIRDLVIRRFGGAGIAVTDASFDLSGNIIAGNYIGIDADGATAAGNGTGVLLADHATFTMVGGATVPDRNVISGNSGDGVRITSSTASDNLILGNYIGTNAAGTAAVANNRGVVIDTDAAANHVGSFGLRLVRAEGTGRPVTASSAKGGASTTPPRKTQNKAVAASVCGCTPTPDNIISGNTVAGVALIDAGGGSIIAFGGTGRVKPTEIVIGGGPNTVTNNFIGTDVTGNLAIPNGTGVQVAGTTLAAIIGEPFLANIIAFNTGAGVSVCGTATGTSIRGNEIHDNGGLGIDLNCDGITANDALDADAGPNELTNFPLIVATGVSEGGGVIHAQPSTIYWIDVYASPTADPSGNGEGAVWIESSSVGTDAAGDGYFAFPTGAPPNTWITLTATNVNNPNQTTSEFSPAVQMYATPGTTAALVDIATKTIPSHVFVGDSPQSVAWNGDSSAVVALEGSKLVRLDMTKTPPPITDSLVLPLSDARNVEINAAGTRALVTGSDALAVYVNLTTTPMTIVGTATLSSINPGGIAFFSGDNKALIADNDVVALLDLTVVPVIPVSNVLFSESAYFAVDIAVNPAGTRAVLSLNGGLALIDLTVDPPVVTGTTVGISEDGKGVAITPDGTKSLFLETGRVGESSPKLYVHDITGLAPVYISDLDLPDWVPTAIRVLPSGTAVIASKFGVFFVDPPYTALTTVVTDSPPFSGSEVDSLDVNAAATTALNLNVDTAALYPNISCTAALAFGSVAVGNNSTQSVTCTNTGGATLTISTIGVTGAGYSLGTVPATPFAVNPTGTFNYQVVFTPTSAGSFPGTATVTNNGTSGNGNTTLSGTGFQQSDLSITKTDGLTTVTAGSTLTYTIVVSNGGPSAASSVPVTDNFPLNLTGVNWTCGATVGSSCGSGGASGNINTTVNLAALGSATFLATGTVDPSATGTLSNTANVGVPAGVTDPNPANNGATDNDTAITQSANLSITKSDGVTTVVAGTTLTYTIIVSNAGPSDASSVPVTDNFPPTLTGVNWTCVASGGSSCGSGGASGNINTTVNLAAGGSATFSATGTVAPSATGTLTNTATVGVPAGVTDPNPTNNGATDNDTVVTQSANLSITKNGPATVTPGQNITYTIAVNNAGPSDASNVSVADLTPPGLTFVSNTGDCTTGYPCALGTMTPGQTKSITTTFFVPSGYTGSVNNTATASSTTTDPNLGNNTTTVTAGGSSVANLAITKSGPANVTAGQNITYTITVNNAGPSDAAAVSVADPTPPGLNFGSNSGDCTGPFPCALGTVIAGGTKTITTVFNVPASYASASVTNTATVSSSTPDSSSANNTSSATTTVARTADVSITKTGPANITTGQDITYTITVTNAGPSDAAAVSVDDPTPAGLTFVSNSGDCTTAFPCALGTVIASGTKTITTVFNVPASYGSPSVTNTATVSSTTPDSSSANNSSAATTTVAPGSADVSISKTGPANAIPGQNITFTVTVTNLGPASAANVMVNDPTPAGLTFVSNTGGCASPYPCSLGTLANGATVGITSTYSIASNATGSISNIATVSTTTTESNGSNNSSTANVTLTPQANLAVTKSGPSSAVPGSNITYTITLSNLGPSDAAGVVLSDPTPSGLTFVSATGSGCTNFPCTIGALPAGQTRTVQATYTVTGASGSVTNTATATSSTTDPNGANNSSSATTITACPETPVIFGPPNGATNVATDGALIWSDVGAASYKVYFGAGGAGCQTLILTTGNTSLTFSALNPGTQFQWRIEAETPGCPVKTSTCAAFTTLANCPPPPALLSPANGTQVASPVELSWSAVPGAINYTVFASINGGPTTNLGTIASTSLTLDFDDGPVTWFVVANAGPQCQLQSANRTFNTCSDAPQPVAMAVSEIQTNQTYAIEWDDSGAARYEVDESTSPGFPASQTATTSTTLTRLSFTHVAGVATGYYYRVRGFSACGQRFGPNSETVRVVIAPIPQPDDPNANAPLGSTQPVILQVFIPGFPGLNLPFTARVDRPWATVAPAAGILPPGGIVLIITVDPTGLPAGTWDATVIVTITDTTSASKQIVPLGVTTIKVPVSVSIVTPVGVSKSTEPPANAMIIPTAGHLAGINSKWQSDIRLANTGFSKSKYQLTFAPAGPNAAKSMKQTTLDVDAGSTIALNDIVRNWYGIGSLGESASGVLEIRPLGGAKKTGGVAPEVDIQTVSVASSRTYNVTSKGTLGQFIPAVTFSSFIAKAGASGFIPVLGLQQIAQSDVYRTNLGVVEGGGKPAAVLISAFNGAGNKVLDFPLELAANEQQQLNGFLASNNINLPDGRLEVKVTSGDGKVTAYASVIDNFSGDPLAVNGVPLRAQGADRYVLPGVATLQTEFVNWQSDVRIFNAGTTPQTATLTYFPQNDSGGPRTTAMTVNPGETRAIDNALPSLFAVTNTGGALHVSTPTATNLVVSARTYNQTSQGTFGQFIPAVTAADGIDAGGGSLQILQVEESVRYRTNIGVFEVGGKPATVEMSVFLPESKTSAKTTFTLEANEFLQFNVIKAMGLDDVYNARIQVRVLNGTGKVAAYGSVIDMLTQDPTFVPAQGSQ